MLFSNVVIALVWAASVRADLFFGNTKLPNCTEPCYKEVRESKKNEISKCKETDLLCLCGNDYEILQDLMACFNKTVLCTDNWIDPIQNTCDQVLVAAAQATETSQSAAPSSTDKGNAPSTAGTYNAEPTSLEEAEQRLGPSAQALINQRPHRLTAGQKAGIAVGTIFGFLLLSTIGFCCGVYQYRKFAIKKANEAIASSPVVPYVGDDKAHASWFTGSRPRDISPGEQEMGYGLDKELGLMISAPSNPRKYTTTKISTVDIPASEYTIPRAPPPAASPQRSPPPSSPSRKMSLGSVIGPQRPSLTISPSPKIILPQATVDDYTPRNSMRLSQQHHYQQQQQQQGGPLQPNSNIPLMFFTPATPQMCTSPTSPSANGEIYNCYSRDSVASDASSIGIAQSTMPDSTSAAPSPSLYDPTSHNHTSRTPSPAYSPYVLPSNSNLPNQSPFNYGQTPGMRYANTPDTTYRLDDRSTSPSNTIHTASSRISSPVPSQLMGSGLHMPPRYAPYTAPPPVPAKTPSPAPSQPEMVDLSAMPSTISRANSQAWRLSVERAADKAMDKVRKSSFEDVPEEEERLTRSDLSNTNDDTRGRKAWRKSLSKAEKRRSGSVGASPSGNGGRSGSLSGYARRSTSLHGSYRTRARNGSMSYDQIDGVPARIGVRRNSRRGSNSSVMMI